MRVKYWLPLIISIALTAPATSPAVSKDTKNKKCSSIFEKPIAVFIEPTDQKIEAMKKENGEDFYTIADDALYYESQATEFLEKMGFPYCFTERESHEFKIDNNKKFSVNEKCDGWCLILWNGKDKPESANTVDLFMYESYLKRAGSQ
jgi:hypothetical protein